jgi:Predicted membrane protein
MENKSLRRLIVDGLMIAIVFLATYFTKIPVIQGYINVGDAVIIVAAILFGKKNALLAGAIGSALSDFALGYMIYIPATFIIKGFEGFLMGLIIEKIGKKPVTQIIAVIIGMAVMVLGYFVAESSILSLIDSELGLTQAIASLPYNIIQGVVSAVLGYGLSFVLAKNKAISY